MTFKPGISGNPNGRPKKSRELKEFELLAKQHAEEMMGILLEVARNKKAAPQARAQSANNVIDRAYGRPTQPIESDVAVTHYGVADHEPTSDDWTTKYTDIRQTH